MERSPSSQQYDDYRAVQDGERSPSESQDDTDGRKNALEKEKNTVKFQEAGC
jgi:hypothetical protein